MLEAHIETKHSTKVYNLQGKKGNATAECYEQTGQERKGGRETSSSGSGKEKEISEKRTRINIRKE